MGCGEGRIGGGAIAVLVFDREVAGDVGMKLRRGRRHRVRRVDHRCEIAVVDDDPLGGVLRRGLALRDHERDRLTDETHPAVGEGGALRDLERRAVLALEMRDRSRTF